MLTDNMGFWLRLKETRYSCFAAAMVTVTAALVAHSAIPLVGCDLLPPKGSQGFYGRDLVAQPARASSQQPVAGGQPWLTCRRSQPANTSQGWSLSLRRIIIIPSY